MRNKIHFGTFALVSGLLLLASISSFAESPKLDSAALALLKQPYGKWRLAWDIKLSAFGDDSLAFPDSIMVKITNTSDEAIEGSSPHFSLVIHDSLFDFGWCFNDSILPNTIRLDPEEETAIIVDLKKLTYERYNNIVFPTDEMIRIMKKNSWKIKCVISDHLLPKPWTESNWTVWSDWLEFLH